MFGLSDLKNRPVVNRGRQARNLPSALICETRQIVPFGCLRLHTVHPEAQSGTHTLGVTTGFALVPEQVSESIRPCEGPHRGFTRAHCFVTMIRKEDNE